jgi:hypothetical protein
LDFEVNGAFRPGVPIAVTVVARGRRQADQMDLELVVHDELSPASTPAEQQGRRRAGALQGGMARGAERRLTQAITFASPGYYRVSARAITRGPTPEPAPGDSLILDDNEKILYILVEENGGRLTNGYDRTVIGNRLPAFGSYGPFLMGVRTRGAAAASVAPVGDLAQQTSRTFTYYIEYDNNDVGGVKRGVAGARVEIQCVTASLANDGSPIYPTVNADGSFTFTCAYGYFDGNINLQDWYSDVRLANGASAGVEYFNEGSLQRQVAASKHAAHVFVTLRTYVPTIESRFAGRWRPRLPVLVSDTDSTYGPEYDPIGDRVKTNYQRVFHEGGRFTTVHEYGHAYHFVGIERPAETTACPRIHWVNRGYNMECAFREGFAVFLAVWIVGNELTTAPPYYTTDHDIETQTFYTSTEGLLIEGSVAGFLYDLVDGSGTRDNAANSAAIEETWDTAVYPASAIADAMETCTLYQSTTPTSYLGAGDQLVYCLEGNLGAEGYTPLWRTTWDRLTVTLPSGWNPTLVRTLWRRNLYGTS